MFLYSELVDSSERPQGQFGLGAMLVILAIPALGILGFQFGYHRWGLWQGLVGALVGGVLAVPLCGIFFSLLVGLAVVMEKLKRLFL